MFNPADALLRGVNTAASLGTAQLTADEINGIGARLGLSESEILSIVERLKNDNAIELHWGGKLSLTAAGRERASGTRPQESGGVTLGPNSIYAPHATGPIGHAAGAHNSNVGFGSGPVGHGATVTAASGDLAALLQLLHPKTATLGEPAVSMAKSLDQEVGSLLQEVRKPQPEKPSIEERVGRIRNLITGLGSVVEAGGKLKPLAGLIGQGIEALTKLPLNI